MVLSKRSVKDQVAILSTDFLELELAKMVQMEHLLQLLHVVARTIKRATSYLLLRRMVVHVQMAMDMLGQLMDRREATADQALAQSLQMALSMVMLITQDMKFTMVEVELLSDVFHRVDFHLNCGKLHAAAVVLGQEHEEPSLIKTLSAT
jgi:hypothetical protein